MVNSYENRPNGWRGNDNNEWLKMVADAEMDRGQSEKREKKIIAAFLTGDKKKYLESDGEFEVSGGARQEFYDKRKNGEFSDEYERSFLRTIPRPVDSKATKKDVFSAIEQDWHLARILGNFTEAGFDHPETVDARHLSSFSDKYKTPMDFDVDAERFLEQIRGANSWRKYEEYKIDMTRFRKLLFGEQEEYYGSLKKLNKEAEKFGRGKLRGNEIWEREVAGEGLRRAKNEIMASVLTRDPGYMTGGGNYDIPDKDKSVFYNMMDRGGISWQEVDDMFRMVPRPVDKHKREIMDRMGEGREEWNAEYLAQQRVAGGLAGNAHYRKILSYVGAHMDGDERHPDEAFDNPDSITTSLVGGILDKYPNPVRFSSVVEGLLRKLKRGQTDSEYREYEGDVNALRRALYGDEQEKYFGAWNELWRDTARYMGR